jgi:hypothetical protein
MPELLGRDLLQLAQYQPLRDGGASRTATLREMVGPVLMEAGGKLDSVDSLCTAFTTLFHFEMDHEELIELLGTLESDGTIRRTGNAIEISREAADALDTRRRNFEQASASAMQEWQAHLITLEPNLDDDDLALLVGDLEQLIALVVAYHGAEATVILYPTEERADVLRNTLRVKAEALPTRDPRLDEARRRGLAQFFTEPTQAQRHYLADRLDFGFFATVGTLGPDAASAIKDELKGQRLYLDTNMLIAGLGLAGRRVNESTRRLLTQSQELGLELAITSRTLQEFLHSVKNAEKQVISRGLPARRYAPVLVRVARELGGVSLIEGYYESYAKQGTNPNEWFRRAAILSEQLEEILGIKLIDGGLLRVERNEAQRVNDYIVLLNRVAAFRSGRPRDDAPMEHDAVHRTLVERLRGKAHRGFGSAQYWFLTQDKILPRFGQLALEGETAPVVPFCISSAAWTQIVRSYTPRTDDYDQMITDLLASPYLRFGRGADLREVQSIVSRISLLLGDEGSPTVVAAFVNDETLEAAACAADETEQDIALQAAYKKAEDLVEQRVATLRCRIEETEELIAAEARERENVNAAMSAAQAEESALKAELEKVRNELSESEIAVSESQQALAEERALGEAEIARLKRERASAIDRAHKTSTRRKVVSAVLLSGSVVTTAAVLAALAVLPVWVVLPGAALGTWIVAPVLKRSRFYWRVGAVLAVASVVLGIITLLH